MIDFDAVKVIIDQIATKLQQIKKITDEAALGTWLSPTLGIRVYSDADMNALKVNYDTLKAEIQALFVQLP